MAPPLLNVDDSEWPEVRYINSHAMFMGCLSSAVKGLGVLVFTWTTVVLLGGFVSVLEKKDFWCLTAITLVQTKEGFEVILGTSNLPSYTALLRSAFSITWADSLRSSTTMFLAYMVRGILLAVVRLLVFVSILLPIVIIYAFGQYISMGISLVRLIQHDYGNADGDLTKTNLKPALDALYSLALVQGFLSFYTSTYIFVESKVVKQVARDYDYIDYNHVIHKSLKDYCRKTVTQCQKNTSFARGRNLVTYATDLIASDLPGDCLSGARILDILIRQPVDRGQKRLIKLLTEQKSVNSVYMLHKLLGALESAGGLENIEMRKCSARIVAHIAGAISLKQFPQSIQYISSLLKIYSLQQAHSTEALAAATDYKELMLEGLVILDRLAADDDNCRWICNFEGLPSMVIAPVTADMLHSVGHEEWFSIVGASLQVVCRLVTTPGEEKLGREIFSNVEAISSMMRILECEECTDDLRVLAVKILAQLPMDASWRVDTQVTRLIVKPLVNLFAGHFIDFMNRDGTVQKLAGEALVTLSKRNPTFLLEGGGFVVSELVNALLDVKTSHTQRTSAAETVEHLCIHYKENDSKNKYDKESDYNFQKLMKALTDATPRILKEILPYLKSKSFQVPEVDIEVGYYSGASSQHNGSSPLHQKDKVDSKLHASLLSLVAAIFYRLISGYNHKDLTLVVATISPGDSAANFATKLKMMVEINSEPTVSCLNIIKIICNMVISMLKFGRLQDKDDLPSISSVIESLWTASKNMLDLEGFLTIASTDRGLGGHVHIRSFRSLLMEAQELYQIRATTHPQYT